MDTLVMRWCAWCLSQRETWQTPYSGTVVHCLRLSHLDTLQLKRDQLDGPLMTRMKFWLCKGRETLRNNHRLIHMSYHRSWNNPCQASSRDSLVCHEAGGALWLPGTTWYIPGIFWCNPLCPHWFQSNTCAPLHSSVPCLQRDGLCVDGLDTPLEVLLVLLTSVLSEANHHL